MGKKVQIGDIIEIPTKKGLAYAQYSHHHPRYGALLRVLNGFFNVRPVDCEIFVQKNENFFVFFPLQTAVDRGMFQVISNCPVPESSKLFPLFRTGSPDPTTGKVKIWWLWDGQKEWQVGQLSPEQRKLSIRGIWNDTILVERIESGWRPDLDNA